MYVFASLRTAVERYCKATCKCESSIDSTSTWWSWTVPCVATYLQTARHSSTTPTVIQQSQTGKRSLYSLLGSRSYQSTPFQGPRHPRGPVRRLLRRTQGGVPTLWRRRAGQAAPEDKSERGASSDGENGTRRGFSSGESREYLLNRNIWRKYSRVYFRFSLVRMEMSTFLPSNPSPLKRLIGPTVWPTPLTLGSRRSLPSSSRIRRSSWK